MGMGSAGRVCSTFWDTHVRKKAVKKLSVMYVGVEDKEAGLVLAGASSGMGGGGCAGAADGRKDWRSGDEIEPILMSAAGTGPAGAGEVRDSVPPSSCTFLFG